MARGFDTDGKVLTHFGFGNDYLYGGAGDDDLDGEDGADTLNGGAGYNDPMYVDGSPQGQQYWNYFTDGGYGDTYAVSATEQYRPYYSWGAAGATYPPYQEVFVTWVPQGDLGTAVPYNVHHAEGQSDAITVNQQVAPAGIVPDDPLPWQSLGVYEAAASVEVNGHNPSPYPRTCVDAVLLRGIDPICDLLTDSNNDGSITPEDDPGEDQYAGPGRILAIGSSQLAEVKLDARAVDAILSEPQQWDAYLLTTDWDNIRVWYDPDRQNEVDVFNEGGDYREHVFHWNITQQGPLDMSVWVEGLAGDLARLQLILVSRPGVDPYKRDYGWTDTVKFTSVELAVDAEVNLTIYDGQEGNAVPWYQEITRGAFTVANMNDTDGDEVTDNVDVDGVLADELHVFGTDEVDLMRLDLSRPYPGFAGKVTLTVPSSQIVLWRESTKVNRIPMDDFGVAEFTVSDYPEKGDLKIWAEAVSPSSEAQGIVIVMSYGGFSDTVRATAVWATLTAVESENFTADQLLGPGASWANMPDNLKTYVRALGGTGLLPIRPAPMGVANGIVMRFTVQPAEVANNGIVFFDIARRTDGRAWMLNADGNIVSRQRKELRLNRDEPNDGPNPQNSTDEADANGFMFSADGPGTDTPGLPNWEYCVFRQNSAEYVRVGIGSEGKDPTNQRNKLAGSRASGFFQWHVRHYLDVENGKWVRTTGDDQPSAVNDVGPDWIDIGTNP